MANRVPLGWHLPTTATHQSIAYRAPGLGGTIATARHVFSGNRVSRGVLVLVLDEVAS